jgi:hypothetical protein
MWLGINYADTKLMAEATDARLSRGKLWIAANETRAVFDDFTMRRLPWNQGCSGQSRVSTDGDRRPPMIAIIQCRA